MDTCRNRAGDKTDRAPIIRVMGEKDTWTDRRVSVSRMFWRSAWRAVQGP